MRKMLRAEQKMHFGQLFSEGELEWVEEKVNREGYGRKERLVGSKGGERK